MANFFFQSPRPAVATYLKNRRNYYAANAGVGIPAQFYFWYRKPNDSEFTQLAGGSSLYNDAIPTTVITGATLEYSGDYMLLTSAEVSFTFHSFDEFNRIEKDLLRANIECRMQFVSGRGITSTWPGASKGAFNCDLADYKLTSYDYTFAIKRINGSDVIECTLKMKGRGNEVNESSIFDVNLIGDAFKSYQYRPSYEVTETLPVQTISDFIEYDIQNIFGRLKADEFDPQAGSYWLTKKPYPDNQSGILVTEPRGWDYKSPMGIDQNLYFYQNNRIVYVSLQYVIGIINTIIKSVGSVNGIEYTYICTADVTKGNLIYKTEEGKSVSLFSADPLNILIVSDSKYYSVGQVNVRTATSEDYSDWSGNSLNIFQSFSKPFLSRMSVVSTDGYKKGSLAGILINKDLIRTIESYQRGLLTSEKDASAFSIRKFLESIFDTIRESTGGAVSLQLFMDENNDNDKKINILVKNMAESLDDNKVTPLDIVLTGPSTDRPVAFELAGNVPSSMQAAAFGGVPAIQPDESHAKEHFDAVNGVTTAPANKATPPTDLELARSKERAAATGFAGDSVTAMKGLIRKLVSNESLTDSAKRMAIPYNLTLTLTLEGFHGLRFGDTLRIDPKAIPARLRNAVNDANGNPISQVVFTVIGIKHNYQGLYWTTEIKTQVRLVTPNQVN